MEQQQNPPANQFIGENGPPPPPAPPDSSKTPTRDRSRARSQTRFNPYGSGYNTTSSGNVRGSNIRGRSSSSHQGRIGHEEEL